MPATRKSSAKKSSAKDIGTRKGLKSLLAQKRKRLLTKARAEIPGNVSADSRQTIEAALASGNWSAGLIAVDIAGEPGLRRIRMHMDTLMNIEEALRKIDKGTYGRCGQCGGPIGVARQTVLPMAVSCRGCQETKEDREAQERWEQTP